MPINRTLSLSWDGVEYDVRVDMRLIDRMEEKLNLFALAQQVEQGDIRLSKVALLFCMLLNAAGAKVTQEQVFEGMCLGDTVDSEALFAAIGEVFAAIYPQPPAKSSATPPKKKAKPKA